MLPSTSDLSIVPPDQGRTCPAIPKLLTFFRWELEIYKISLETARLPSPEGDADHHPDRARDFGGAAQVQPEQQADQESCNRRNQIGQFLLFIAEIVAHERRGIDAHERDQRSEVQHLRAQAITE